MPIRKTLTGSFSTSTKKDYSHPYRAMVDFARASTDKRLFLIDNATDKCISTHYVAHGAGSGGLIPDKFSNRPGSNMSSLGIYKCAETYVGKHGKSLKLDGLDATNSNVRKRYIVMHTADYVSEKFIRKYGYLGRSQGCLAIDKKDAHLIDKLANGGIIIVYR